jgi:large subunit ribosomal protein L21
MYAIVDIAGQQFKVEKDKKIFVHRLNANEGEKVEFDNVLLIDNDGAVDVGKPSIANALVTCKVLSHVRGDKVLIFKKKRRKGYQKLNGHRQDLTELMIESIDTNVKKKQEPAKKESSKPEAKETAPKKETTAKKEPANEKAAAGKKEAKPVEDKKTDTSKNEKKAEASSPKK